jgi:DNA-binding transcriptional ArsR family regulator
MTEEARLPEPDVNSFDLVTVLGALADRWRLAAVRALDSVCDPVYCGQLMHEAGFNVAKSTVSHHMRVLREAGVTRTYVVGARRYTYLRRDDLNARFPGLLDAILAEPGPVAYTIPADVDTIKVEEPV